jgi:methionyl aminopeptidase
MIKLKNPEQVQKAREGGKILAHILRDTVQMIKVGANAKELDDFVEKSIIEQGGKPSFKGYGGSKKFPSSICFSVNDEIVHGVASADKVIKDGDIVSIDLGMEYKGMFTDMATTVAVGKISPKTQKLLEVTKTALDLGIEAVRLGNSIADISKAVQRYVEKNGFGVVQEMVGHGVGFAVHEDPAVPNYFDPRHKKVILKEGMMIAIEPMVTMGHWKIKTGKDGWTASTADGSLSAHFEHTVVVTKGGYEILTKV